MKKKAFTLIELLVVISIISILSTLIFVNIKSAKSKANDARRYADLRQMATALELYYANYSTYPSEDKCDSSVGSCNTSCPCNGSDWSLTSGIHSLIDEGFFSNLPIDPINNNEYFYMYEACSDGEGFLLRAKLEKRGYYYQIYQGDICALCDVDADGDVDGSDLATFAAAYGSKAGDGQYNIIDDFDNDGMVDDQDLATLGSCFGRTDTCYWPN